MIFIGNDDRITHKEMVKFAELNKIQGKTF